MMQSEFENLLGHSVDYSEYEKIETVYVCFEKITKQEIANLYKRDSQFVVNSLYNLALDINKADDERNARIDELRKCIVRCNETMDNMIEDNDCLQKENDFLKKTAIKYFNKTDELEIRIEELETQLHQYKALFADIEKNATVNLYEILLGVTQ